MCPLNFVHMIISLCHAGKPIPGILDDPERWGKGQHINYAGAHITVTEIVETFKRVTGDLLMLLLDSKVIDGFPYVSVCTPG